MITILCDFLVQIPVPVVGFVQIASLVSDTVLYLMSFQADCCRGPDHNQQDRPGE